MKTIYLLRHAKSSWKDPTLDDFDRPLAKRGKRAGKIVGDYMLGARMRPDLVLCSAARRTRETLKLVQKALGADLPAEVELGLYHAEWEGLLERLGRVNDDIASVMMIGHNPGMEMLARGLADGGDEDSLERMHLKFPTAALAVFTTNAGRWRDLGPGGATLESFTLPRDLE